MIQLSFKVEEPVRINGASDTATFIRKYYESTEGQEMFSFLPLSQANAILGVEVLSIGGLTSTVVDPAVLFRRFLPYVNAKCMILVHNHPSGVLVASDSDKSITKKIKQACELFDVRLLDHIILAKDKHLSFAEEGLI